MVVGSMKQSLDTFDRRFDTREIELLEGPELRDGAVWIRWRATYRVGGAPPLAVEGEETAAIEGGRIRRLEDRIADEVTSRVLEWMDRYRERLK